MAEGKKGFILYRDLVHTVSKMPKEKAGELFITILQYVNDEEVDVDDLMVALVFEPIKQQLKRDLEKWSDKKEHKSESGKLGNLKRWHSDLYDKVIKEELTLKKAQEIAKDRKVSHPDKVRSQSIANVAVTVNDTVNVTVSDKVKVNASERKIKKDKILSLDNVFNYCLSDSEWLFLFGDGVHENLKEFLQKLKKQNVKEKSIEDFQSHFANWHDLELKKRKQEKSKSNFPDKYDSFFEKKLQGNELMKYYAHLKKLGWNRSSGPGGSMWNAPSKN